jgi:hypothetical protein
VCRLAFAVLLTIFTMPTALAYRPFDSTDADVAEPGVFELELGPIGERREDSTRIRVAPAVVANYGLPGERELVLQGQREKVLNPEPGEQSTSIVDTGAFIKQVLREGALQEKSDFSVATEYGLLLPDVHGDNGTGATAALIASQRSDLGTMHLNGALAWNRDHEPELFLGVILEGPFAWTVRPVAEVFSDKASNTARTDSALVGAIWRVSKNLALDFGLREARSGDVSIREVRAGLTWSFSTR